MSRLKLHIVRIGPIDRECERWIATEKLVNHSFLQARRAHVAAVCVHFRQMTEPPILSDFSGRTIVHRPSCFEPRTIAEGESTSRCKCISWDIRVKNGPGTIRAHLGSRL